MYSIVVVMSNIRTLPSLYATDETTKIYIEWDGEITFHMSTGELSQLVIMERKGKKTFVKNCMRRVI